MRAIDTNVVVRFLVDGDNPGQAQRARSAINAGDVFVSLTVLLESVWVLRSTYGFNREQILRAIRAFADVTGVTVEQPAILSLALDWVEAGMDFADALHLAKSDGCSAFISFDRRLAKATRGRASIPVVEP